MSIRDHAAAVLAGASFVISIVVVVLWYRSLSRTEDLCFITFDQGNALPFHYHGIYLASHAGGIELWHFRMLTMNPARASQTQTAAAAGLGWTVDVVVNTHGPPALLDQIKFGWIPSLDQNLAQGTESRLRVPDWFLFLLFASPPMIWFLRKDRWRRRQRIARGLCPACGYDLRATPDRCPECGEEVVRPTS